MSVNDHHIVLQHRLVLLLALPVAGSRLWNSLPLDLTSAPTPTVFFRNRLKAYLFPR